LAARPSAPGISLKPLGQHENKWSNIGSFFDLLSALFIHEERKTLSFDFFIVIVLLNFSLISD
jgi:hypothetical protein